MPLFGGALFAVNYFLLGAMVGGLLNTIVVARAMVFPSKDKLFRLNGKPINRMSAETDGWTYCDFNA